MSTPRPERHIDKSLVASSGTSKIDPNDVVEFGFDKTHLDDMSVAQIDRAALFLKHHPYHRIVLQGFASSPGTVAYNDQIASARMQAVRTRLMQNGIVSDRIITVLYGERASLEKPADERVMMYATTLTGDAVAAAEFEGGAPVVAQWTVNGKQNTAQPGVAAREVTASRK